jgi:hypothetical protein
VTPRAANGTLVAASAGWPASRAAISSEEYMTRILIAYGTTEGHTAKVAERMRDVIQAEGLDVDLLDAKAIRKPLAPGA